MQMLQTQADMQITGTSIDVVHSHTVCIVQRQSTVMRHSLLGQNRQRKGVDTAHCLRALASSAEYTAHTWLTIATLAQRMRDRPPLVDT